MPQDINALLAALKSKEGSSGFPPDDESDAAPDQSMPSEDAGEGSPEDSAEDNAKVVGLLQDQYPTIYAKLMKQIETDPADDASTSGDDASAMSDMMQ